MESVAREGLAAVFYMDLEVSYFPVSYRVLFPLVRQC